MYQVGILQIVFFIFIMQLSPSLFALQLYGHRGARGLAPENTLPGYQAGLAHHVDCVDVDIGMTKDHIIIAQHDLALNPDITRDAKGKWLQHKNLFIKNLTLKEVQAYDVGRIKPHTKYAALFSSQKPKDGTHIPTLREVIHFVKKHAQENICFQIEIKTDPTLPHATFKPEEIASALVEIIHKEHITNVTEVQSSDWRSLQIIKRIDPKIKTAYLTDVILAKEMQSPHVKIAGLWTAHYLLKNYHYSIPQMIHALGGDIWNPQDLQVTKNNLREAHRLGLKVVVWTWDDRFGNKGQDARLKKLIALGIDGLITDRPDRFKQYAAP